MGWSKDESEQHSDKQIYICEQRIYPKPIKINQTIPAEWERKDYSSLYSVMGFHNFIKVNMINPLCILINDTGKTMRKY